MPGNRMYMGDARDLGWEEGGESNIDRLNDQKNYSAGGRARKLNVRTSLERRTSLSDIVSLVWRKWSYLSLGHKVFLDM